MKELRYRYTPGASDLFQARLYYAWSSYLAVVNICMIAAAVALIVVYWAGADWHLRLLMLIFLSLFTVIQPLYLFFTSRRAMKGKEKELTLVFSNRGLHISSEGREEALKWEDVAGWVKKPTLIIVYSAKGGGYILTNRVLKESRNELIALLEKKLNQKK